MSSLSKKLSEKIQKEHISQLPHWVFVLKNIGFWGLYALSILFGAIAFSLILYAIFSIDTEVMRGYNKLKFFLTVFPLLWTIFFGLFALLAYYGIRHTKNGYRFSLPMILMANLLGSVVLGLGALAFGGAEKMEESFSKIPYYPGIHQKREQLWNRPIDGFLAGRIIRFTDDTVFILEDMSQKEWEVTLNTDRERDQMLLQKVQEMGRQPKVRLEGEVTSDDSFEAEKIMPWKDPGLFEKHNDMKGEMPPRLFELRENQMRNGGREGEQIPRNPMMIPGEGRE